MQQPDPRRLAVVEAARSQIGRSDPAPYWDDTIGTTAGPKHWCGGFALWAIHQAGLGPDIDWKVGVGFCYLLPTTTDPQPGDIAYFERHQHHAIVERIDGDRLYSIDGNQPDIQERVRPVSDVAAFYSIAPLLEAT